MHPWAKSVPALSKRVSYGCSADSVSDVEVTGMMTHFIGMMTAGVRRPSGSTGNAAVRFCEVVLFKANCLSLWLLSVGRARGNQKNCFGRDMMFDSAKRCNSCSLIGFF